MAHPPAQADSEAKTWRALYDKRSPFGFQPDDFTESLGEHYGIDKSSLRKARSALSQARPAENSAPAFAEAGVAMLDARRFCCMTSPTKIPAVVSGGPEITCGCPDASPQARLGHHQHDYRGLVELHSAESVTRRYRAEAPCLYQVRRPRWRRPDRPTATEIAGRMTGPSPPARRIAWSR